MKINFFEDTRVKSIRIQSHFRALYLLLPAIVLIAAVVAIPVIGYDLLSISKILLAFIVLIVGFAFLFYPLTLAKITIVYDKRSSSYKITLPRFILTPLKKKISKKGELKEVLVSRTIAQTIGFALMKYSVSFIFKDGKKIDLFPKESKSLFALRNSFSLTGPFNLTKKEAEQIANFLGVKTKPSGIEY